MLKKISLLILPALALAVTTMLPVKAQPTPQACQWNYTIPSNISIATYCGNTSILGNETISGNLNVTGVVAGTAANTVNSITALEAISPATAGQAWYLTGYSSTIPTGGGSFVYRSTDCDIAGVGDGGTQFPGYNTGCWVRQYTGPLNVLWFGAKCMGQQVLDGVSTSSSNVITSATAKWTASMVGWTAIVNKAAASGKQLETTISGFTNSHTITISASAGASGTAETISVFPNDATAIANTFNAANNQVLNSPVNTPVGVTLPTGMTCGMTNPNAATVLYAAFPALYLNGGELWLGQTGASSDTGYYIDFLGYGCTTSTSPVYCEGGSVIGPGVIQGLYQTNQGISQLDIIPALLFNNTPYITKNAGVFNNVRIYNTKGSAIQAQNAYNFSLSNVVTQSCGDYSYQHSGTAGDMVGRPQCVSLTNMAGALNINGLTANNAAQAGLLIESISDPDFHASITNCYFTGNGYYGFDDEVQAGTLDITNCLNVGNGIAPTGVLISGGYILRDVANFHLNNVQSTKVDSNALVLLSVDSDSNIANWSLSNVDIVGTSNHAGQIYLAFGATGAPERIALENVNYDTITVYVGGSPACSATQPQQQLLKFHNLTASQGVGPPYSTIFNPVAGVTGMLYIQGDHSNLGAVSVVGQGGTNNKWGYWDTASGVQMNGVPTFSGGLTANTYAPTTLANPQTSFTCP
jgi:hypothetical protein